MQVQVQLNHDVQWPDGDEVSSVCSGAGSETNLSGGSSKTVFGDYM